MKNSRRQWLKKSLGVTAAVVSAKAVNAATCGLTQSQTSGPFIPDDFPFRDPAGEGEPHIRHADSDTDLTQVADNRSGVKAKGQVILFKAKVVDQFCQPVIGASVYLWQADVNGHYNHEEDPNVESAADLDENFQYRAVTTTNSRGEVSFKTILPKYYPLNPAGTMLRTAHLHVSVRRSGVRPLVTQTYFEGDVLTDIQRIRQLNKTDIILSRNGKIRNDLKDVIAEFKNVPGSDVPVGEVTLKVERL